MRILLLHTRYIEQGGEDIVFDNELRLLQSMGDNVSPLVFDNNLLSRMHGGLAAINTIYNASSYKRVLQEIREYRPNIMHVHNTFPLASPSVILAAHRARLPVVLTLHNYRLLCPNALLYRDNMICEDCLGKLPYSAVIHSCYRGSKAATAVVAGMLMLHRFFGTWDNGIQYFIALTEHSRKKFVEGGFPAEKVLVKPNFLYPDPGIGEPVAGKFALFVGRLSPEKGIDVLLEAWSKQKVAHPLLIIGTGPLNRKVAKATDENPSIRWLGRKPREDVVSFMKQASFLVLPSVVYENFPMTIVEAFAAGLPVVASDLGAMASLVDHGRTGLRFRPGDASDLAEKVEWLLSYPHELDGMRKEARREYEVKYTAERNYKLLMEIYERAIEAAKEA